MDDETPNSEGSFTQMRPRGQRHQKGVCATTFPAMNVNAAPL
jgi:hypothetical protein